MTRNQYKYHHRMGRLQFAKLTLHLVEDVKSVEAAPVVTKVVKNVLVKEEDGTVNGTVSIADDTVNEVMEAEVVENGLVPYGYVGDAPIYVEKKKLFGGTKWVEDKSNKSK